ncbi:MAG: hypothetical protein LBU18_03225 [Treponema sp.]|nr:hypothetical protein [Treponema sp.]
MAGKKRYLKIDDFEYGEKFGIIPGKEGKREAALKKAWENRDFEIDKFWTRSAYFWGFIALIFGAYIGATTGTNASQAEAMYLDLYLILLGGIFSTAWLLVIKGSKRWQENWEAHIDKLEDGITGPLYKTVYCNGKRFYSVSKINMLLAWVVIITWCWLLIMYIVRNIESFKNFFYWILSIRKECIFIVAPIVVPIALAIVSVILLVIKGQSSEGKYMVEFEGAEGVFVDRNRTDT